MRIFSIALTSAFATALVGVGSHAISRFSEIDTNSHNSQELLACGGGGGGGNSAKKRAEKKARLDKLKNQKKISANNKK